MESRMEAFTISGIGDSLGYEFKPVVCDLSSSFAQPYSS